MKDEVEAVVELNHSVVGELMDHMDGGLARISFERAVCGASEEQHYQSLEAEEQMVDAIVKDVVNDHLLTELTQQSMADDMTVS